MQLDFTTGSITGRLLRFALPMMAGNLLQQCYNVADTLIVGKYLGPDALAAVGSSYTLMVFLTSILLGLCMGSGAACSIQFGRQDTDRLLRSVFLSFCLIAAATVLLTIAAFLWIDPMISALQAPPDVAPLMRSYLWIIFLGIPATFLYNYFATLLRAVGNSVIPLLFLGASALLNVGLDLAFVLILPWGVQGAAGRHRTGAIRFRHRDRRLYPGCVSGAAGPAAAHGVGPGHPPGNFQPVPADLHPAIGDESGHSDGAGARQQLWHLRDGGVRRGGEDRFLCIYARAGFRKRLFHLRGIRITVQAVRTGSVPAHGALF